MVGLVQEQQIDSISYWRGYEDGMSSFDFNQLEPTAAGLEVDGSSFGMDGVKFTADSENGMFDTTLISVIFIVGVLFSLTFLTERWLKIWKEYFKK